MTKCMLPSGDSHAEAYTSYRVVASKSMPGVTLAIHRVSFGRRLELARRIRTLDQRLEFLRAGDDALSKVEAAIVSREIDQIYLAWGLAAVDGLEIDGRTATVELLIESGPESVVREALDAIKAECSLSPEERKN